MFKKYGSPNDSNNLPLKLKPDIKKNNPIILQTYVSYYFFVLHS